MSEAVKFVPMENTCPRCGDVFDSVCGPDHNGPRPRPRDIVMCATCGNLMRYDDVMTLENLTGDAIARIQKDPKFGLMLAAFELVKTRKH